MPYTGFYPPYPPYAVYHHTVNPHALYPHALYPHVPHVVNSKKKSTPSRNQNHPLYKTIQAQQSFSNSENVPNVPKVPKVPKVLSVKKPTKVPKVLSVKKPTNVPKVLSVKPINTKDDVSLDEFTKFIENLSKKKQNPDINKSSKKRRTRAKTL